MTCQLRVYLGEIEYEQTNRQNKLKKLFNFFESLKNMQE